MSAKPTIKTSETHPLRIDEVAADGCGGVIGLTFCPGKVQSDALTGNWERDLGVDLQAIREWGATALVNLLEVHEMRQLKVSDLGTVVAASMEYFHLPIRDGDVPGPEFEQAWASAGVRLRRRLQAGEKILIHCKGGLGRTGTVAARLLIELGLDPEEAIRRVRRARPGSIETRDQEEYVRRQTPPREQTSLRWQAPPEPDARVRDRFLGCLLGGAVGDALGAPVEFMRRAEILRVFGPGGIRDFALAYGRLGAITDDTQMTLFTAEGMIRAHQRLRDRGITTFAGVTANAYLRWLRTQGETSRCQQFGEPGWLVSHPELHARRAPGNTCLAALKQMKGLGDPADNDSKGCGGVMRVAPVGLFGWHFRRNPDNLDTVFRLGTEVAALTHGNPSGFLPAGVMAVLVLGLAEGVPLPECLAVAKDRLAAWPDHTETSQALEHAERLAAAGTPPEEAISALGEGWVAEEALAISVYCALTAPDFAEGVIQAVNHDGDSDSTGAMTGNLLGARWGGGAIPDRWLNQLELRTVIEELTEDLWTCPGWGMGRSAGDREADRQLFEKYPPH